MVLIIAVPSLVKTIHSQNIGNKNSGVNTILQTKQTLVLQVNTCLISLPSYFGYYWTVAGVILPIYGVLLLNKGTFKW